MKGTARKGEIKDSEKKKGMIKGSKERMNTLEPNCCRPAFSH
jgi:hypothetical protein